MTLQELALGVERKLLGQTLPISAAHGCGLHANFGREQGYAELSVEEWVIQLVWPNRPGRHGSTARVQAQAPVQNVSAGCPAVEPR